MAAAAGWGAKVGMVATARAYTAVAEEAVAPAVFIHLALTVCPGKTSQEDLARLLMCTALRIDSLASLLSEVRVAAKAHLNRALEAVVREQVAEA